MISLTSTRRLGAIEEAVDGDDRLALVLGSEGHGLSSRWSPRRPSAIISMRAGIDSLNVAAASAFACYAAGAARPDDDPALSTAQGPSGAMLPAGPARSCEVLVVPSGQLTLTVIIGFLFWLTTLTVVPVFGTSTPFQPGW